MRSGWMSWHTVMVWMCVDESLSTHFLIDCVWKLVLCKRNSGLKCLCFNKIRYVLLMAWLFSTLIFNHQKFCVISNTFSCTHRYTYKIEQSSSHQHVRKYPSNHHLPFSLSLMLILARSPSPSVFFLSIWSLVRSFTWKHSFIESMDGYFWGVRQVKTSR